MQTPLEFRGAKTVRLRRAVFSAWLVLAASVALGQPGVNSLTTRSWFEARTAHFCLYSCASTREVARLADRLEQFREAYSLLAGAQAVASPPIVVLAFPDHASVEPFLPLYQDRPSDQAAFFSRGSDENLIVLALTTSDAASLRIIFHEYTHLLLRHNQPYWPMWLAEGMAEIYSTFQVKGRDHARLGLPVDHHLSLLAEVPLWRLRGLFSIARASQEYNERRYSGIFYAESWLLTHYLMLGDNPAHKANFPQLSVLLRQGQSPEQAFTNAFHTTLPAMEEELSRYLARGKFTPLKLTLSASLEQHRTFATRSLTPMEVCYRLGDELLHIGRLDAAESYFRQAGKLAPDSPLPSEGLGLLAARRGQPDEAVRCFRQAMQLGSLTSLAHFTYAREKWLLAAKDSTLHRFEPSTAADILAELQKSLELVPDFGPAHHLLGVFEMVQGQDLAEAERHIECAIQLEPENQSYLLALAQVQLARNDPAAARRTLEPLLLCYVDPAIRAHAEEMLKALAQQRDAGKQSWVPVR
jgi:Flp pilus assembly protein TadD